MARFDVDSILEAINYRYETKPLALVAIDGVGGAGKSTLARELAYRSESILVVQTVNFYRPMDPKTRYNLTPEEGYMLYYDWERLRDQVLIPLSQGKPCRYQRYSWVESKLKDWVEIHPQGIVLVEGVFSFRPELRRYYDFSIFVTASESERYRRQIVRKENPKEWIERWMAAENWYIKHHAPQDAADLLVDGNEMVMH
ncbi:MAG: hypothetical protein D6719_12735 [Candidatus Dadabacteria bacterium]|nr:MAG: hypothetical protein D6719_12735 [Candidatus Dadabacteria bacterium]